MIYSFWCSGIHQAALATLSHSLLIMAEDLLPKGKAEVSIWCNLGFKPDDNMDGTGSLSEKLALEHI